MNTKALKQKILDLAIHGKLVPQDPNDESACVLLEKIRAEKETTVKQSVHKAPYEKIADGREVCIADEVPFELPEGWAWCRLGDLYNHTTGKALKKDNAKGILRKYITTSNLYWNSFDFTEVRSMHFTDDELPKCTATKGDLLLCNGGDVGRAAVWNFDYDICFQNHISRLRPKITGIDNNLYLNFIMYNKNMGNLNGKGVGITSLSATDLLSLPVPLPPLAEQRRIVQEIECIFAQIDLLEQNKTDLQTAIKQAKSKILDLAIHGKLVPQDPADEPASSLLERIRQASGQTGAENTTHNRPYTNISDDEKPFEIPDSWAWCILPGLCTIPITDGTHQTPTYSDKEHGIPFLSSKDVTSQKIDWSKIKYITRELHEILYKRIAPQKNDILLAKNGTTGIGAIVEDNTVFDIYVTLAVLRPNQEKVSPKYLLYTINSPFCKNQFNSHLTGIGVPNLHLNDICKTVIPLPPLAEQHRIVSKIEEIFSVLDSILNSLRT